MVEIFKEEQQLAYGFCDIDRFRLTHDIIVKPYKSNKGP